MAGGVKYPEVYLDMLSQPCRALHILLSFNKVPFTIRTVALRKGEQKTPEFTSLNPMQKVPVLVDNGFVLTESVAILKYLVTKYSLPEHWYPSQPERRAKVLIPRMTGSAVDGLRVERALAELKDTLDMLESMFLKRQPFLCGDDITLADLLAVCELMQPLGGDRDVLSDRPKLQRWRSRVQSALGESFDDAHSVLYKLRDNFKSKL
ncbi:glutathione S-transferase theta-2 isoform X2 [Gadus macrocephalus]|uniref:glutathione S-transferase theta-2 isoform X2 n=1 Tax=Gadus macrocephalus TaxID=80720 RepID=UPI0028CB6A33|nr:glutathione S-transferase theta-2 isoform X2 [Gadus macrocephalus]